MGIERIRPGAAPPKLEAVAGRETKRPASAPPEDRVDLGTPEAPDGVRWAKVSEARLKIMNGYYARRDIQMRLAERLILELDF